VGDIFGSLLAIEATAAFFLESTFIGVWVFGWNKLSPKLHATAIWLVAIASNLSAVWIILANGFMQHPVGYAIRNGRAELSSFTEVITNGYAWNQFLHTVTGALALAGFFVLGVSAWHLLRRQSVDFFTKSFRIGAAFALIFSVAVALVGHRQGNIVAEVQPAKLAAMESHWETTANAPMYLLAVPDPANEGNSLAIGRIPGILSIMAFNSPSAVVKGLKDFPKEDRPPVTLTFSAFRLMVGLGTLMIVLGILAFIMRHHPVDASPRWLKLLVWAIPVPYLGLQAGWPWPRWDGSPGSSTASCAPRTRSRPSPPPRWPSAWRHFSSSTSCLRPWTSTCWPSTPASSRPRPARTSRRTSRMFEPGPAGRWNKGERPWISVPSGLSSGECSGRSISSWTDTISASAPSCRFSPGTTMKNASCTTPWGRFGTATRCGSSRPAA
jgi:hypothetical protein